MLSADEVAQFAGHSFRGVLTPVDAMGISSEDRACLGRWVSTNSSSVVLDRYSQSRAISTHRPQSKALSSMSRTAVGLIANLSLQKTLIFLSVLLPVSLRLWALLYRSFVHVTQPSKTKLRHQQAAPRFRAIAGREPPALWTQVVAIANPAEIRYILLRRDSNKSSQSHSCFVEPAPSPWMSQRTCRSPTLGV